MSILNTSAGHTTQACPWSSSLGLQLMNPPSSLLPILQLDQLLVLEDTSPSSPPSLSSSSMSDDP